MACCKDIVLKSTKYTEEQLKYLGKYILKPTDVVENHPVYKHELNDEHIAFSADYGWTVYPNTPDDKDPPLVSLNGCKPPAYSDCPIKCVNSGQWTYFYQNTVTDKNKTLSLNCFEEADPSEGGVSAGAVVGIIIALLLAVVLIILSIDHHKPDWLPKWLQNQLSLLKLRFSRSSNGEQSHPDGRQSVNQIENGEEQLIPVKTANEQKKKTLKVVVSPTMLQLPIEKCVLKVTGVPTANEQNSYKYFFSLKKDQIEHNDSSLEELSPEYLDNVLQLSQFKSLAHGVYNYKVKVISSDQKLEEEDSGKLTIYPESFMVDAKDVKYEKLTSIKEGDRIWSDSKQAKGDVVTILQLPSLLKGASLFKLPMRNVEVGTVFTITALPRSTVYIVQEKNGGWKEETLLALHPSWTKESCTDEPFQVSQPVKATGVLPKEFIVFSRETESIGSTTKLPEVTTGHKHVAIFLKEAVTHVIKDGTNTDEISDPNKKKDLKSPDLPEGYYLLGGAITSSQNSSATFAGK